MKVMHFKVGGFTLGSLAILSVLGCPSIQNQSTLNELSQLNGSPRPFVEGYIEYPGPNPKWAGPSSLLVHIVARDAGAAQISTTPELFKDLISDKPGIKLEGRAPASTPASTQASKDEPAYGAQEMTSEAARELLAHLATSLQGAERVYRGCLSMIKVRLIRTDGEVLEKQGCRGFSSWSRAASETTSQFINAMLYGVPARQPAS